MYTCWRHYIQWYKFLPNDSIGGSIKAAFNDVYACYVSSVFVLTQGRTSEARPAPLCVSMREKGPGLLWNSLLAIDSPNHLPLSKEKLCDYTIDTIAASSWLVTWRLYCRSTAQLEYSEVVRWKLAIDQFKEATNMQWLRTYIIIFFFLELLSRWTLPCRFASLANNI